MRPIFEMFGKDMAQNITESSATIYDVWVFGYHRIGWKVCEALDKKGVKYAVVDYNPDVIDKLTKRHVPVFFGDASDVEFLESTAIREAKLVISTLPNIEDQKTLLTFLRHHGRMPRVILNAYHNAHVPELYAAGADYVMMPHLLGGSRMADVLEHKPWSERTFGQLRREQHDESQQRFAVHTDEV
jgi:Trk K+ transport system NAD-binding subunit